MFILPPNYEQRLPVFQKLVDTIVGAAMKNRDSNSSEFIRYHSHDSIALRIDVLANSKSLSTLKSLIESTVTKYQLIDLKEGPFLYCIIKDIE